MADCTTNEDEKTDSSDEHPLLTLCDLVEQIKCECEAECKTEFENFMKTALDRCETSTLAEDINVQMESKKTAEEEYEEEDAVCKDQAEEEDEEHDEFEEETSFKESLKPSICPPISPCDLIDEETEPSYTELNLSLEDKSGEENEEHDEFEEETSFKESLNPSICPPISPCDLIDEETEPYYTEPNLSLEDKSGEENEKEDDFEKFKAVCGDQAVQGHIEEDSFERLEDEDEEDEAKAEEEYEEEVDFGKLKTECGDQAEEEDEELAKFEKFEIEIEEHEEEVDFEKFIAECGDQALKGHIKEYAFERLEDEDEETDFFIENVDTNDAEVDMEDEEYDEDDDEEYDEYDDENDDEEYEDLSDDSSLNLDWNDIFGKDSNDIMFQNNLWLASEVLIPDDEETDFSDEDDDLYDTIIENVDTNDELNEETEMSNTDLDSSLEELLKKVKTRLGIPHVPADGNELEQDSEKGVCADQSEQEGGNEDEYDFDRLEALCNDQTEDD